MKSQIYKSNYFNVAAHLRAALGWEPHLPFWVFFSTYRCLCKVNSVQEACNKCFGVHILKFEILQITWKKWNKEHQTLSFQFFTNRFSILMFFVLFFHVVYKISNFNKWTAKHLAQTSCTELTLTSRVKNQWLPMFIPIYAF